MKKLFSLVFVSIYCLSFLSAQVVVNEYSASNLTSFVDQFSKTEDWIELYNNSGADLDISGYGLSDKIDKPLKYLIPEGTIMPANGILVFWCSGRDLFAGGEYHTNFKLSQTTGKDMVVLAMPDGTIINDIEMDVTLTEHSRCRVTDGADEWAICTSPGPGLTNDGRPQFRSYTNTPSMAKKAGFYQGPQMIEMFNNEANSVIRYTTNGDNPTESSPIYEVPFELSETTVVKATSFSNDADVLTGKMRFATIFIDEPDYTLPVFSVAADEVVNLANGQGNLRPIGSLEYFDLTDERVAVAYGELNRHGQDSWVLDHRSLDWITRDEMGYEKVIAAKLFDNSDRDEYQRMMFRNSGDDNYPARDDNAHEGSAHVRDEYVQHLSRKGGMHLDTRTVQRVVVFLNGQYWGVYGMREKIVDHDFTDEYYDQGKYDLHYITTWGSTDIEYGGQAAVNDWVEIRDFVLENDMGVDSNYNYVASRIDLISMSDYFIANLNTVAKDWLNYNTGWWRGTNPDGKHKKWGYNLWDLDATFDYYINYTNIPNSSTTAEPCDIDDIADYMDVFWPNDNGGGGPLDPEDCATVMNGSAPYPNDDEIFIQVLTQDAFCCESDWDDLCQEQYDDILNGGGLGGEPISLNGNFGKHEKMFLKLQEESATYRQLYYSRNADLRNTVYTCENMHNTLDSMIAIIEPEMQMQIDRWGGTLQEWEDNVQQLFDFVDERCTLLDEGMVSCFDLTGPYQLTLMTEPIGIGEIDLNTLDVETFPWDGEYYGNMENIISANVWDENEAEWKFDHWETANGNVIFPDVFAERATLTLTGPDTLTAVYSMISSVEDELLDEIALKAYPNPVYDHLVLEYNVEQDENIRFEIYDVMGKEMGGYDVDISNNRAYFNFDRSQLSNGFYYVNVIVGNKNKSFKVTLVE